MTRPASVPLPDPAPGPVAGIRTGIGGWTYAPWRGGAFYPEGLVQRLELDYASRALTAIEINGTFHRSQSRETYARWRDAVPDGFVFSAKAPMRIVGARNLAATRGQVEDFVDGIATLGDRLGPLVWQFDEARAIDDADDFEGFVAALPRTAGGRRVRHVLDVRHPGSVDAALVALARRHGVATVCTDSRTHPAFADLTADFVYARLMRAEADVPTGYPQDVLAAWAAHARTWAGGGDPADLPHLGPVQPDGPARDVFVFFIGAGKVRNPAAAQALQALLERG